MLNYSYLGISSGLPGSKIDVQKYLVLIGIQSFDDLPHLDDLYKSIKKYGSLSCYLAASAVYEQEISNIALHRSYFYNQPDFEPASVA